MNIVYQTDRISRATVPLGVIVALACTAQLMVVLDGLVVNVALPDIRAALGMSASAQQWIVNGYLLSFGGLLLLAARAADVFGHRRVFLVGAAVFTLASLAGGLAADGAVLIGARFVQGIGAAALAPASLSLLTTTHTGAARNRALSIWSATSGSAGALGLVLGGVLTSGLGWRWVLLVNVPIGVVLFLVAAVVLVPRQVPERPPVDVVGAVALTLAVGGFVYSIAQAQSHGVFSVPVTSGLAVSVVSVVAIGTGRRRGATSLVPAALVRQRTVVVANVLMACLGATMTATVYFLSLRLQGIGGASPLRTGLELLPMSVVITAGAIRSRTLLARFGTRPLLVAGGFLMVAGLTWLAVTDHRAGYVRGVLGPTLVWAAGASIVTMPCVALATAGVARELAGVASGLVNTARQLGAAVGLAALTVLVTTGHAARGYQHAFAATAGLAAVVAVLAVAVPVASGRDERVRR